MATIFYNCGSTYIDYGTDKTIRTDDLSMCEAMLFALELKCDFDWEDVTSDEINECIDELKERGFEIDTTPNASGFTDGDFFRLMRNYSKILEIGD